MTRDQHVRSAVAAASSAAHEAVRGSDLEDVVLCAVAAAHHGLAALKLCETCGSKLLHTGTVVNKCWRCP